MEGPERGVSDDATPDTSTGVIAVRSGIVVRRSWLGDRLPPRLLGGRPDGRCNGGSCGTGERGTGERGTGEAGIGVGDRLS